MFTANSQEALPLKNYGLNGDLPVSCRRELAVRCVQGVKSNVSIFCLLLGLLKKVYARTKLTLYLPLLFAPVKLRTYLGTPIHCGDDKSPAEFAARVSWIYLESRMNRTPAIGGDVLS